MGVIQTIQTFAAQTLLSSGWLLRVLARDFEAMISYAQITRFCSIQEGFSKVLSIITSLDSSFLLQACSVHRNSFTQKCINEYF